MSVEAFQGRETGGDFRSPRRLLVDQNHFSGSTASGMLNAVMLYGLDEEASFEQDPERLLSSEQERGGLRERCEQWLERSREVVSPTALELTNVPLWLRELNDEARAQAQHTGVPFERITLGSLSIEQLDARFHNDDAVYLINLYKEDPKALEIARKYSYEWSNLVNDFDPKNDVRASGFAVMAYEPNPSIARDWEEVESFIDKMHELDKKVIVDLVPNHVGLSHPWAREHPEYFIQPTPEEYRVLESLHQDPSLIKQIHQKPNRELSDHERYLEWLALSFERIETDSVTDNGEREVRYYAHGKDPYFIPWIDTLQLNYTNPDLQRAMRDQVLELVRHGVDGVRCDMAHLLTATRMRQTWGGRLTEEELAFLEKNAFWPPTIIEAKDEARSRAYNRAILEGKSEEEADEISAKINFLLIAEAYEERDKDELGNLSPETSQWASDVVRGKDTVSAEQGEGAFDLIYAKDFLDHLYKLYKGGDAGVNYETVRNHLRYIMSATEKGRHHDILFLENHDEDRAAATFGEASKAFATLLACVKDTQPPQPGEQGTVFLVHQGQDEGRTIRPRMQMARLPSEHPSNTYKKFYRDGKPEALVPGLLPLKGSRLLQEGECRLLDLDSSYSNPSLFAFQYRVDDPEIGALGAVVTINLGNHTASGRIPGIKQGMDVKVSSMTMRREIERPDSKRTGGLYVELAPYEVQIAYYDPTIIAERAAA